MTSRAPDAGFTLIEVTVVLAILGFLGGLTWVLATPGGALEGPVPSVALYGLGVARAVVLTEQVLRRRDLGPVTLNMVHAPEADDTVRQQG